ncbi:MAG: helix-turn-helix domain-containing protein [Actinomycetota bacterium]|nr:helix-turn-helix domain-containing protein [Actinomycetota bacterium]
MERYDAIEPRRRPTPAPVRRAAGQLAESLQAWRKLQGLTQSQVADRAGIGVRTLARLEHGDAGVRVENLFRVLRALGLLDSLQEALDPYSSDLGRLRADEQLPRRVRTRRLGGRSSA